MICSVYEFNNFLGCEGLPDDFHEECEAMVNELTIGDLAYAMSLWDALRIYQAVKENEDITFNVVLTYPQDGDSICCFNMSPRHIAWLGMEGFKVLIVSSNGVYDCAKQEWKMGEEKSQYYNLKAEYRKYIDEYNSAKKN